MRGKLVYLKANGKGTTRVGVLPEGEEKAIFFDVEGTPDLKKGDSVEFDPKARTIQALKEKEDTPLAKDPRPYINRSVALQCATELLAAEIQAGLVPMEGAEEALIKLARKLEAYLNSG